jgi:hypothetical protein
MAREDTACGIVRYTSSLSSPATVEKRCFSRIPLTLSYGQPWFSTLSIGVGGDTAMEELKATRTVNIFDEAQQQALGRPTEPEIQARLAKRS